MLSNDSNQQTNRIAIFHERTYIFKRQFQHFIMWSADAANANRTLFPDLIPTSCYFYCMHSAAEVWAGVRVCAVNNEMKNLISIPLNVDAAIYVLLLSLWINKMDY